MSNKQARAGKYQKGEYAIDADSLEFMHGIVEKRQGTLSAITIEKTIPESVPSKTVPALSPIPDDLDIAAYHQGLAELGALASWGGTAWPTIAGDRHRAAAICPRSPEQKTAIPGSRDFGGVFMAFLLGWQAVVVRPRSSESNFKNVKFCEYCKIAIIGTPPYPRSKNLLLYSYSLRKPSLSSLSSFS